MMSLNFSHPAENKTCIETSTGINICCADYEERNATCYRCAKGFTSESGKTCMRCKGNWYGDKCRHDCQCSAMQLCHHIDGCTDITTERTWMTPHISSSRSSMITIYSSGHASSLSTSRHEITSIATTMETFPTTLNNNFTIEVNLIAYYALSGVVLVLLVCLGVVFYKYRKSVKKRIEITNRQTEELVSRPREISDNSDPNYEVIDERNMANFEVPVAHDRDYLEVISGSYSSGSDQSNTTYQSSYLQPVPCAYNSNSYQAEVHADKFRIHDHREKLSKPYQLLYQPLKSNNPYNTINVEMLSRKPGTNLMNRSDLSRSCGYLECKPSDKAQTLKRSKSLETKPLKL